MRQDEKQEQPTYEELLEFYQRHNNLLEDWAHCVAKESAEREKYMANLSSTWTGRLVLLATELKLNYYYVVPIYALASLNFWLFVDLLVRIFF